jgi:TatA/E family protein of Tat protein translocase
MIYAFFNLGFGEIFVIFVLVLLLFGADKIPEFARSLGKGIRMVKDATDGVKRDIQSSVDEVKTDMDKNMASVRKDLEPINSVHKQVKHDVGQYTRKVTDTLNTAEENFEKQEQKPTKE